MGKKIYRNSRYLAWLRTRPCCVTGATIDVQAAHIRLGLGGGMGIKPSDYRAVPIQAITHRQQHQMGEKAFWLLHAREPEVEIMRHLAAFCREIVTSSFAVCTILDHGRDVAEKIELLIDFIEGTRPTRYKK